MKGWIIFSTDNTIKKTWPKDINGDYKQADIVIEDIIGKKLHDRLKQFWSGMCVCLFFF